MLTTLPNGVETGCFFTKVLGIRNIEKRVWTHSSERPGSLTNPRVGSAASRYAFCTDPRKIPSQDWPLQAVQSSDRDATDLILGIQRPLPCVSFFSSTPPCRRAFCLPPVAFA